MDENEISRLKKEAAEKAKAAAIKRKQEKESQAAEANGKDSDQELAKKKAAAAAKAKAAAAAKAKAARLAGSNEKANEESEVHVEPSPNDPFLKHYIKTIESQLGSNQCEEYYINRLSKDVPTILAKPHTYYEIAQVLKQELQFEFLSELHGTDFETHMEVYVHLSSFQSHQSVALKVKIDRDNPIIPSLVPLWEGANWPECEAYDLLGIQFSGHPNLKRILLGEEWVGYPLRKDYQPYDVEV